MDYPGMQGQSRSPLTSIGQFRLNQQRRATILGIAIALIGLALLLWPREHRVSPTQGDDIATLATLVNLPAVPLAAHWSVAPQSEADAGRAPGPTDWTLDATITFSASDAAKISGVETFYKAPLLTGKLIRVDDTHMRLILTTQ
jgi:hypothetical protein